MRSLGIERLDTVMGLRSAAWWCSRSRPSFPGLRGGSVHLRHRGAAPFAIALRSIQREAITSDPAWKGGNYSPDAPPVTGRLARKLGTVTYRSAAEWQKRFGREPIRADMARTDPFASEFAVQGYLESLAQRFVSAFDANCYLYLSRAMDRFELDKHGDPVTLLRRANLESALVIGVQTDLLFSVSEQRAIAHALEHAGVATRFAPLSCIEGTARSSWI
jgi:homoserine O-acetyltransferase